MAFYTQSLNVVCICMVGGMYYCNVPLEPNSISTIITAKNSIFSFIKYTFFDVTLQSMSDLNFLY